MPKSKSRREAPGSSDMATILKELEGFTTGEGVTYDPATGTMTFLPKPKAKPRPVPTEMFPQGNPYMMYPEDAGLISPEDIENARRQWLETQKRKRMPSRLDKVQADNTQDPRTSEQRSQLGWHNYDPTTGATSLYPDQYQLPERYKPAFKILPNDSGLPEDIAGEMERYKSWQASIDALQGGTAGPLAPNRRAQRRVAGPTSGASMNWLRRILMKLFGGG